MRQCPIITPQSSQPTPGELGSRDRLTHAPAHQQRSPSPPTRPAVYKAVAIAAAGSQKEIKSRTEGRSREGALPRGVKGIKNFTKRERRESEIDPRASPPSKKLCISNILPEGSPERPVVTISNTWIRQSGLSPPSSPPPDQLPSTPGKWVDSSSHRAKRSPKTPERSPPRTPSPRQLLQVPVTPGKGVISSRGAFRRRYQ